MLDSTLLTLDEAARALGVRPATLSRWLRRGQFPGYRTPSGRYQIAAEDIEARLHLSPVRRSDDGDDGVACAEVRP